MTKAQIARANTVGASLYPVATGSGFAPVGVSLTIMRHAENEHMNS